MNQLHRSHFQLSRLLSLADLSKDNILSLLNTALLYRKDQKKLNNEQVVLSTPAKSKTIVPPARYCVNALENRTVLLLFEKPSTRTYSSIDIAVHEMGGHSLYINTQNSQLSRNESFMDSIGTLERYCSLAYFRVNEHKDLEQVANETRIPIINALSNAYHPCEALAAFVTWAAYFNDDVNAILGRKLAFIGDCSNVAASLAIGCAKLGIHMTLASPKGHGLPQHLLDELAGSGFIHLTEDPKEAAHQADILYTDTFVSMGNEVSADERDALHKKFQPFQINSSLAKLAKDDYLFFHCLPAYRGEEVAADIIDGERSAVFEICESRVYLHKAILSSIF